MSTIEKANVLDEAIRLAMSGKTDAAFLRRLINEVAPIQEEIRKKYGDRELSLELLREVRDE